MFGITDVFNNVTATFTNAAKDGIETVGRFAQEAISELEATRELDRAVREAEQIVNDITRRVQSKADDIERDLRAVVPSFDSKLDEIINNITETASSAAENGIDIIESINGAVEMVFQEIQKALETAINSVNQFLHNAADELSRLLDGYLPGSLNSLLAPVRALIESILSRLNSLAETLKNEVRAAVEKIKATVQCWVKRIGEELGPIWDFVKKLWKLLFGAEPEQCQLTAQWFDERIKRAERDMLSSGHQVVIRKRTYLELLPPADDAWKTIVSEFLDTYPVWSVYRARLMHLLTTPRDGHLVQISVDEVYTDRLGGQQRIQISVLHYRWRTESFRKVSSGFLGILAMVSAIGKEKELRSVKVTQRPREQLLEIDPATATKIYKLIEPNLWLRKVESEQSRVYAQDRKARVSRQIVSRDENGWRKSES